MGIFHAEEDYHQITPNDLLLGRTHRPSCEPTILEEGEFDPKAVLSDREQLVRRWWKEWERKVFPTLLPRGKWHHQHRNVVPGDIVLIQYKGKVNTVWKLGKVEKVFPDKHGVVRTCEVVFRPKHSGEKLLPYKAKPLNSLRTAVQRLCVLLPKEELLVAEDTPVKPDEVSAEDKDNVPEERGCVVPIAMDVRDRPEDYEVDEDLLLEEGYLEDKDAPAKVPRREKMKRSRVAKEPSRFSKRLAGFSAAVTVAADLDFYLSSEEDVDD